MKLLDSNILIYAVQPEYEFLDQLLTAPDARISAISIPEVLGFSGLDPGDEEAFEAWFADIPLFDVTRAIVRRAALLRRAKRMKSVDAIIAATALEHGCELVTRNEIDFHGLKGLKVVNPFHSEGSPAMP